MIVVFGACAFEVFGARLLAAFPVCAFCPFGQFLVTFASLHS